MVHYLIYMQRTEQHFRNWPYSLLHVFRCY